MDKLQAMATFVAVVDAGSFVGAISATGLSKPAVSRQVSELEQALGTRLLHRTTRSLSLTEDGRRYFEHCKELLVAVSEAEHEVSQQKRHATGRLRVGVPHDFGLEYLAPLWGEFLQQNPQVMLDIVLSDRTMDPIEEGYDMVVRENHSPNASLVGRPLASTRMLVCASPDYLASSAPLQHPEDLASHSIIAYSHFANSDAWRMSLLSSSHSTGPSNSFRVSPRIHASSGATCRALAIAGQGIILQPEFLVFRQLQEGRLVHVLPQWQCDELSIHLLYPTRTLVPIKVQRLRDFLLEKFQVQPWRPH